MAVGFLLAADYPNFTSRAAPAGFGQFPGHTGVPPHSRAVPPRATGAGRGARASGHWRSSLGRCWGGGVGENDGSISPETSGELTLGNYGNYGAHDIKEHDGTWLLGGSSR